jgi:hypothetical protein
MINIAFHYRVEYRICTFGPPTSGCKARGLTGTLSTCLSVYVKASCIKIPPPSRTIPRQADAPTKPVYLVAVIARWVNLLFRSDDDEKD